MEKGRLDYIDVLRAFSMFLIVYSHLVHYGLQRNLSLFNGWTNTFMVPLFFFISGFVAYNANRNFMEIIKKRLVKYYALCISPLIFLLCYSFYRETDFFASIGEPLKGGYWFTIVLFQISIIACVVNMSRHFYPNIIIRCCVTVLMMYGVYIISKYNRTTNASNFTDYLSLMYVTYYFYYYMLGEICRQFLGKFHSLLSNSVCITIIFILSFVPLTDNQAINYIPVTARVFLIYYMFYYFRTSFNRRVMCILLYIGRHTLEIYFIHYFLLFRCHELIPVFTDRPIVEICVFSTIAIVIMLTSCLIRKMLDVYKPIAKFLFG
ncbi:acyltransferase family protein [Parabacteroides distasonis]|nr:acyltransferase family protein [Parabacteroides distasonis]